MEISDKKTIFLHMGAPKTASSYLQEVFYVNKNILLEEYSIIYPFSKSKSYATGNGEKIFFKILQKDEYGYYIKALVNGLYFLSSKKKSDLLLSCENFSTLPQEKIVFFLKALGFYFRVKILFLVRDPLEWSYSVWNQMKNENIEKCSFFDFLTKIKYSQCFTLSEVIDSNNFEISVVSYDKNRKNIFEIACTFLSASPNCLIDLPPARGFINRQLTFSELRAMEFCADLVQSPEIQRVLINSIAYFFRSRFPKCLTNHVAEIKFLPYAIANHKPFFFSIKRYLPLADVIIPAKLRRSSHNNFKKMTIFDLVLSLYVTVVTLFKYKMKNIF